MKEIFLYNRHTSNIEKEIVFKRVSMDFLYGTCLGRIVTWLIVKRKFFSRLYGYKKNRPSSKNEIKTFIKNHSINISEIKRPLDSFTSMNDFFVRELKETVRPIELKKNFLISPADARLLVYKIQEDTILPIKGATYKIDELLHDKATSELYSNSTCLVFRLAPSDYHRFCYIDNGSHNKIKTVNGSLHSVSPLSLIHNIKVFSKNYRQWTLLKTENFGNVIHIDIGALVVGRIIQHLENGGSFKRGMKKGFFEFGGSTIVLLFRENVIAIDEDIMLQSDKGIETLVKYGSKIGELI